MKLYSVAIIQYELFLVFCQKKTHFFNKNLTEIFKFLQIEIAKRTPDSSFLTIHERGYVISCFTKNNISCTAIIDKEYPIRTVLDLSKRALGNPDQEYINILFKEYQKPPKNKITEIQNDLVEIKQIMFDNIEKILKRGEKLEDIVEKTEYLSQTSKEFLKKSKKVNKCCWIL